MSAENNGTNPKSKGDTVKQTIVETVEAPRLEDINVTDFVTFKEKRAIYERKVAEKNADARVQIPLTTYRNSVEESVLQLFIMANWVNANSVDDLTDDEIKECIEKRARVDEQDYDLGQIERDIRNVWMEKPSRGANLEKQVWRLCLKYSITLTKCGYDEYIKKKPKIAIKHIFKRINHKQLKSRMRMILDLRKDGYKEDFDKFVRKAAEEARVIYFQDSARRYLEYADASDSEGEEVTTKRHRKNKATGRRGDPKRKGRKPADCSDEERNDSKNEKRHGSDNRGRKRRLPKCLNPKCDGEHFLMDCPNTAEDEKRKLKEAYHEAKRAKKAGDAAGKIGKISSGKIDDHTSLFSASFYDGAVESVVMADQGADANVLSPSVLKDLIGADPALQVTTLKEPRSFYNALQSATPIRCSRVVKATVRLRIRHGSALSLANIKWFVSDDELDCICIGRHVLAAIGLDNRRLLSIACDRNHGYIDIQEAMDKAGTANEPCAGVSAGSICGILRSSEPDYGSTYHSKGDEGSDFLEDADVYINVGEDTPEELEASLVKQVECARANGLSEEGCTRLTRLRQRYRSIFEYGWENPDQPMSNRCGCA